MAERKRVFKGERLRQARENRQMSQEELAGALKMGQSQLAKYESGNREPSPEVIVRFA